MSCLTESEECDSMVASPSGIRAPIGRHPCETCGTNWVEKRRECSSCRAYRSRYGKERSAELARRETSRRNDREASKSPWNVPRSRTA